MAKPTARTIVLDLLGDAHSDDVTAAEAEEHRHEALVYALLSVADEIRELRHAVSGVEVALKDQSGFGVGTHARYISDWLEKIASR
ncbi:hypothetical protein [Micromonospora inositola]|uniref:Uncharacterized protein n=1 Tax=Micromonospora inositola TaxID=47865 RepID=A0A1C5IPF2_9ACTN|nr:hypothetical protein [Micromonospora inositola]SCG60237.1 hypothetical protein GA0070613_3216 [Micromonospora inositola]